MKLPPVFRSTRMYWAVTVVMCLFMGGGALFDIAKTSDAVKLITQLGYPEYFIRFIGVMKLLGVAAILAPKIPRLKQWAYAGLVFDTGGALFSHLSVHNPPGTWAPALLGLLLVLLAYLIYSLTVDPFNHQNNGRLPAR